MASVHISQSGQELGQIVILQQEHEQGSTKFTGVYRSDLESEPVFLICESEKGQRQQEISLTMEQLTKLRHALNHVYTLYGQHHPQLARFCAACGSEKPIGQSCGCFDNNSQ
jgi:hypothetical protein